MHKKHSQQVTATKPSLPSPSEKEKKKDRKKRCNGGHANGFSVRAYYVRTYAYGDISKWYLMRSEQLLANYGDASLRLVSEYSRFLDGVLTQCLAYISTGNVQSNRKMAGSIRGHCWVSIPRSCSRAIASTLSGGQIWHARKWEHVMASCVHNFTEANATSLCRFYNGDAPFVVTRDINFVEHIFVRHFQNFVDRGVSILRSPSFNFLTSPTFS